MKKRLYYIGGWNDSKLICYCKDGQWRPYRECEENWDQVLVLPSPQIYEKKDELVGDSVGIFETNIHVRNSQSQRMIYLLISFSEAMDYWVEVNRTLANSYSEACLNLGVDYGNAQHSFIARVVHYSDIESYELAIAPTPNADQTRP